MRSNTSSNRRHDEEPAALTDLERALDAMPANNFMATLALFAEMYEDGPEATKPFMEALGLLMGKSMRRCREARGPLDPDTQAFVDVIVGYFDDE